MARNEKGVCCVGKPVSQFTIDTKKVNVGCIKKRGATPTTAFFHVLERLATNLNQIERGTGTENWNAAPALMGRSATASRNQGIFDPFFSHSIQSKSHSFF